MKSSEPGSKKITTALLMIPSMTAATFITGAALFDMSSAYAQDNNACKAQSNLQGKFNSNPHCPTTDPNIENPGPPIPSSNAAGFNDETQAGSQVESTACENASGATPPPCLAGSRRR